MSSKDETQWAEVFSLYDADKDKQLTQQEFCSALRVLGRRYTAAQFEKILTTMFPPSSSGGAGGASSGSAGSLHTVDYETYVGVLGDPYDGPKVDDLRNALRAFDGKDSQSFTVAQIRSMLTSMGDKLSEEELAVVLEGLPLSSGGGGAGGAADQNGTVTMDALIHYFTPPVPSSKPNIPEMMKELIREELHKRELQAKDVASSLSSSTTPSMSRMRGASMVGGGASSQDEGAHHHLHDDEDDEGNLNNESVILDREVFS